MNYDDVISYFPGGRRKGNTYKVRCPNHEDRQASLSISLSDEGKILFKDFGGCKTCDILKRVGLSMKEVFGNKSGWEEKLKTTFESRGMELVEVYHFNDASGKYLYSKARFRLKNGAKTLRYITISKDKNGYEEKKPAASVLYRLPELISGVCGGRKIFVVEGEKDVESLRKFGLVATTAGGVRDWKKDFSSYFTGSMVYILPDNDPAGEELSNIIKADLRNYAHSVTVVKTSEKSKGDVTDWINDGHTKEELISLLDEGTTCYARWVSFDKQGNQKINADILADAIGKTLPFVIVRRRDDERDDLFVYSDGVYQRTNKNGMKSFIKRYLPLGMASDNLLNNVYSLLLCQSDHIHSFDELDANEEIVNVRNGLYEIKTGKLLPHTPKILSTIQLDCEFDPADKQSDTTARFFKHLCTITDDYGIERIDSDKLSVLQEFSGLVLSNCFGWRTKKCLVLWSRQGNSGKSQLLSFWNRLLQGRCANVPIQNMNENSRFTVGSIMGTRLVSVGDQTATDVSDSSLFKQLTGGDVVKLEKKGKQPDYIVYRGCICIACNNLPFFSDDRGSHIYERLQIIDVEKTIPESQRDPTILDKMWTERNAFFLWSMQGLKRLIDQNYKFSHCIASERAMLEYRCHSDTVFDFLSVKFETTGDKNDKVKKTDFEDGYRKFCEENGRRAVEGRKAISDRMEGFGFRCVKSRFKSQAGVMCYVGLRYRESDFITYDAETGNDQFALPERIFGGAD